MTTLQASTPSTGVPVKSTSWRPDIQGLRAIAVGLVLIYHAGAPFLPGGFVGVDVFFVISGFLITGHLLKEATTYGRISLPAFYAARARRIIPAATLTLIVTALLSHWLLPPTRWQDIGGHILGSAFYVVNWTFAADSVDYLNADDAASPVQHFWTLAVEEQFYILWPLLLVALLFFARTRRGGLFDRSKSKFDLDRQRKFISIAVLVLTIPSFVFSIYYTEANPGAAYFVTTTRMWELGIGAMIAVFAVQLAKLPDTAARLLGWAGLGAILAAGFLYSAGTSFPGYAALLPTLGAGAVIVAGMAGRSTTGVGSVMSLRPMMWVGGISYSLYLWHWPLIVIGTYLLGGLTLGWGLAIVAISFIPAYLSFRYVENPLRNWSGIQKDSDGLYLGSMSMVITALLAMFALLMPTNDQPPTVASERPTSDFWSDVAKEDPVIGAALLASEPNTGKPSNTVEFLTPSAAGAPNDNPAVYGDGCHRDENQSDAASCVYGDEDGDFTVAIAGDSHAAQWVPALSVLAEDHGWRLETYTKSSCPVAAGTVVAPSQTGTYDSCTEWNENVLDELSGPAKPDLLLLSSQRYLMADGSLFSDALAGAWEKLDSAGVPFAVLADVPRPGINVPECVAVNPEKLTKCAVPRDKALENGIADQKQAAREVGGVELVDLTDSICPTETCSAVVGNVLVYRDSNHITATYSRSLAGILGEQLGSLDAPMAPAR